MPAYSNSDNDRPNPGNDSRLKWPNGRPPRVGVLSNPLSGSNSDGLGRIHQVVRQYPGLVHQEARTPGEVLTALERFAAQNVGLIAINGGDGTIQAVLTGLFGQRPFDTIPALALLYGGTSNMLAKDFGLKGPQHRTLDKLLRLIASGGKKLPLVRRPVLRVESDGQGPLFGMFFGAACIYRGIEFFHSKVHTLGLRGELAHGLILARFLSALISRKSKLVAPSSIKVQLENGEPLPESYLVLLISSLEKLILGLRPYWGKGPGPLHMTAVADGPKHLLKAIAGFVRGTPNRYLNTNNGYHSLEVETVGLKLQGGFTLDGELYRTSAPHFSLRVSTGGYASFVCQHG